MSQQLAAHIQVLAVSVPETLLLELAAAWQACADDDWTGRRAAVGRVWATPDNVQRALAFLEMWQQQFAGVSGESVALGLATAARVAAHHRHAQQLELVWTGPDSRVIPLRRTDQALLQVIDEARSDLHIVSFAVYKVQPVAQALVRAAQRGVALAIYLETPDASEGKIAWDTVGALGQAVRQQARVYVWPKEKRPLTEAGYIGSLHAKLALADGKTMLISSANLTEYALTVNMEMGLLVRGGPLPGQVRQHLQRLVEQNVFRRI